MRACFEKIKFMRFTVDLHRQLRAQTILSRKDSVKIARRFNAGNGSRFGSGPVGTDESWCPCLPSLRDTAPENLNALGEKRDSGTPNFVSISRAAKRRRAAALQDAGALTTTCQFAKRLGVRQPSGALARRFTNLQLHAFHRD